VGLGVWGSSGGEWTFGCPLIRGSNVSERWLGDQGIRWMAVPLRASPGLLGCGGDGTRAAFAGALSTRHFNVNYLLAGYKSLAMFNWAPWRLLQRGVC
jgi:hypothetical protein